MSRIRLALFYNHDAAAPVRDRLMEAGIAAEIHEELQLQRLWFVSKTSAGARLEVTENQWQHATRLLQEWEKASKALSAAIRCPECHSLRVDYPQFTRKSFLTNLVIGFLAQLRLVEREYYCEDCHCMWSRPGGRLRRPRAHQAPNYFIEGVK